MGLAFARFHPEQLQWIGPDPCTTVGPAGVDPGLRRHLRDVRSEVIVKVIATLERTEPLRTGAASTDAGAGNAAIDSVARPNASYVLLAVILDTLASARDNGVLISARAASLLAARPKGLDVIDGGLKLVATRMGQMKKVSLGEAGQLVGLSEGLSHVPRQEHKPFRADGALRALCALRAAEPTPGPARGFVSSLRGSITASLLASMEQRRRGWSAGESESFLEGWQSRDEVTDIREQLARARSLP